MAPPLEHVPPTSHEPPRTRAPLQTWDDFERDAQDLWGQGLRGDDLMRVLGREDEGPSLLLRTPGDFARLEPGHDGGSPQPAACDPST